jgi:hypothetical protein
MQPRVRTDSRREGGKGGRRGEGGRGEGREMRPRGCTPASARTHCLVRTDAVFTASADGKNPSAGKTASAG